MNITMSAKAFAAAMALPAKVIPAKAHWVAATHLRIATNDTRVTLTGTSGDMSASATAEATVLSEGVIALPFDPLSKFVAAAKGDTISIEVTDAGCVVKSGRGRITLAALPGDDFPMFVPPEHDPGPVDGPRMAAALRFCLAGAADSEVQYNLNGVNITANGSEAVLFGGDAKSIHRAKIAIAGDIGPGGIVPRDAVGLIATVIEKASEARLYVGERAWMVTAPGTMAFGKVVDSTYPDLQGVLNRFADWRLVLRASREDLSATVSLALCGADVFDGKSKAVAMIGATGSPVVMRGVRGATGVLSAGRGETEATATDAFAGGIDPSLLGAVIATMDAADLEISFSDTGGAWRVLPVQADMVADRSAVITAMRMSEQELSDAA